MSESLSKSYTPSDVEDKWYAQWIADKRFVANPLSSKPAYSIVIPPPNVTGVLTMGHVLNNTLQDILSRRKRMQGFEVMWLPGTDHAGIATQTVVERSLIKSKTIKHRDDLGREAFVNKIWEWKDKHGGIIINQLKKLGCSCDWDREVFTMDGLDARHPNPEINYSDCVQKVFVDLYNKGLIYRGTRMINWCPVSRTALSDEEVIMKESDGYLWHFQYPVLDASGKAIPNQFVVVATTRPETMLGDEGVAVHPDDERYATLIGCKVLLPLQEKAIPIVADSAVDKEFGTGAVKVTPAHDPTDNEIGKRHHLPETMVIGYDGRMTANAGDKYAGMDRYECREAVVVDLKELGLVLKIEPHRHNVGYSERADVPVEPMLSEQWFLKYPSAKESVDVVASGKLHFFPERWSKVYAHWMNGIRDWCISRQLWWGHRIPAWYCGNCKPIVSIEKPTSCPTCGATDFTQDPDVLDTWFSSWLWPFATMGWPHQTDTLKKFYPTTDLVTGPDIIFFWVARMIMAGLEYMNDIPFKNVYFTGIIRDAQGRKMSKSLGNSPDPLDLFATYGADGVRFGLMMIAPQGMDILFSDDRMEIGRNFCNKLWNASRFVMMNIEDQKVGSVDSRHLSLADKWILTRMNEAVASVNQSLDRYEFDAASRALYQFVWREFCDWYVELAKVALYQGQDVEKETTRAVLVHVLDTICRLLHPFAPFITEEIWQHLPIDAKARDTIMMAAYPSVESTHDYKTEADHMSHVMDVVTAIRNLRGEHNVPHGKKVPCDLVVADKTVADAMSAATTYISALAKAEPIVIITTPYTPSDTMTAMAGGVEIHVPMAGIVDIAEERERLTKQIEKLTKMMAATEAKLANESFVSRAPANVVEVERQRLRDTGDEKKKLEEALERLPS